MNTFEKLQGLLKTKEEYLWTKFYEELEVADYIDSDYRNKTQGKTIAQEIRNAESMELPDVVAWLTWILRGERFCDGLFQSCIDDGTLSVLLDRGNELLNEGDLITEKFCKN